MVKTITFRDFEREFKNMGRGDQFSRTQLRLIFGYLEESDPNSELDVIGVCHDWSGYDSLEEALEDTGARSLHELKRSATVLTDDEEYVVSN